MTETMELLFLGTGTSLGVPMIGCDCPVCRSGDSRNRRRRSSLYVTAGATRLLIDTPPDFRDQALTFNLRRVDAVLFTHAHADHILGLDDIRRFNTLQNATIPAYTVPEILAEVQRVFAYIGQPVTSGLYRPKIAFHPVKTTFQAGEISVTPLDVTHGDARTVGYLLEWHGRRVGYFPDCHSMPAATRQALSGMQVMILDALRHQPHPTHLCVAESVALLREIGAPRSYVVHLCHELEHARLEQELPPGMAVGYDGLVVRV